MSFLRGWFGEKKATFNMWLSLDSKIYRRFHNIILPSQNGTTQIDHLVVSPFRLFIVETKNKQGWIFGSESQAQWTQVIYKHKYTFQNPLRQTYRQKKVLCEFLGIDESLIHTIVYFVGDCTFKSPLPINVMKAGISRYIKRFQTQILSAAEIDEIINTLETHKSTTTLTRKDHIRSLRQRHNSAITCPKCGSDLVERVAKNGPNAGFRFLGCSAYPKCRFTRAL